MRKELRTGTKELSLVYFINLFSIYVQLKGESGEGGNGGFRGLAGLAGLEGLEG